MVSSTGLEIVLTRVRFPLTTLVALVTARAPCPPAITGLPTPSLSCVAFAFRTRLDDATDSDTWVVEDCSACDSFPVS